MFLCQVHSVACSAPHTHPDTRESVKTKLAKPVSSSSLHSGVKENRRHETSMCEESQASEDRHCQQLCLDSSWEGLALLHRFSNFGERKLTLSTIAS